MNTERSSFIHIKSNAFITIIKFGLDCGVEARVMGREMKMMMSELRSISQIFFCTSKRIEMIAAGNMEGNREGNREARGRKMVEYL